MKLSYSIQILLTILVLAACSGDDTPNDDTSDMAFSIITTTPTEVTQIKATIGGTITGATLGDVNEVGVVYGLSANPTTNDMVIKAPSETLDFSVQLTDLDVNTQYFARSYVMLQNEIFYGDEINFATLEHYSFDGAPILTSQEDVDSFFSIGFTQVGGFIIQEDEPGNITDLSALSTLLEINSSFSVPYGIKITGNVALNSLEGLENLRVLNGNVAIGGNNLSNISQLSKIEVVEGDFFLSSEPLINSLEDLSNLKAVDGQLGISGLENLESLAGLENIEIVSGELYIVNNANLTDFCSLQKLIDNGFSNYYTVFLNKYNPTLEDLQAGNCSQ